jgi:lipopolysaccharide/colanic/teichoic acid biosynthesis glycosyltransferase
MSEAFVHRRAKRALDLTASLIVLVVTLPVQAAVALAVRIRLGRQVLFRQIRLGLYGKRFTIVKFRTMLPVDPTGGWIDDSSRLTPLGCALRTSSLDELPSLWNVIKGDMSLVGPRPLLPQYLERYTPEQTRRHDVYPGLTGLAQVSGRNALSWEDRLVLDVEYVQRQSFALDLRILSSTVGIAIRRQGITAPGSATMGEFLGSGSIEKSHDAAPRD